MKNNKQEHAKKMARLRRMCEIKKNGKCNVPAHLHKQWAANVDREEMLATLESCDWDRDPWYRSGMFCVT